MLITVITPAYNAADTIAECIDSVMAQSHPDTAHVVVDDGSGDGTAAVAGRLAGPRLRLLRQPHAGVSAARNAGMAAAEGDAVLFLDADDRLAPEALATLAGALEAAPAAVAAVGSYARVDGSGPILQYRCVRPHVDGLLPGLLVQNRFANPGHVLLRRDAVLRAGRFQPGIAYGEDWEFLIRVALLGPFAVARSAGPLLFVRSRAAGAYRRLAANPDAFLPCMHAIFANPQLLARFGPTRLAAFRARAEAENHWIIGRELIRRGDRRTGRHWLRRSIAAAPCLRRAALLAVAHLLPWLPPAWQGPFRRYPAEIAQPVG